MAENARCVDCSLEAPEDKDTSLISSFGWRLMRTRMLDGSVALEWRCPECWERYKATRGVVGTTMRPAAPSSTNEAQLERNRGGKRPT